MLIITHHLPVAAEGSLSFSTTNRIVMSDHTEILKTLPWWRYTLNTPIQTNLNKIRRTFYLVRGVFLYHIFWFLSTIISNVNINIWKGKKYNKFVTIKTIYRMNLHVSVENFVITRHEIFSSCNALDYTEIVKSVRFCILLSVPESLWFYTLRL